MRFTTYSKYSGRWLDALNLEALLELAGLVMLLGAVNRDRVGFAAAGEAMGGLRYFNGYPDQAPPRAGISLGDTLAAKQAFEGILMALFWRDARGGGKGQVIDAAIVDACFAMTESTIIEYGLTGVIREPSGSYLQIGRAHV